MSTSNTLLEPSSFKSFLFQRRRILYLAAAAIVVQFAIFKYLYPFASYIHGDSFSYIEAARQNFDVNTYLIGYSKFLRIFNVFSRSDTVLVSFQYLLLQSSSLLFILTIFYFYSPSRLVQGIILVFTVFNPLLLHLANLISSDGFFLSLSMIWFALLIWIIHRPSWRVMIWHAIILFLSFTVRYNAMIYPVIALVAFGLSNMSIARKVLGFGLSMVLCVSFVITTQHHYKSLIGISQYSPFSGWQLANNAIYAYRFVPPSERRAVPAKFKDLDEMIRAYIDSTRDVKNHKQEAVEASSVYMWWESGSPLFAYQRFLYKNDSITPTFQRWAAMAPFLREYGGYTIRNYPLYYLKHFAWPNSHKYYAPPVEFLNHYNSGADSVIDIAEKWFRYNSLKVHTRMSSKEVWILNFYPILSGIANAVMLSCLICYLILKGWREKKIFNRGILLAGIFWIINAGFTIFASSAALRFQSFPVLLTTTFCLLLVNWIAQSKNNIDTKGLVAPAKSVEVFAQTVPMH
jgi:hypothetical protein